MAATLAAEVVPQASMRFVACVAALLVLQVSAAGDGRGASLSSDGLKSAARPFGQSFSSLVEIENGGSKAESERKSETSEAEAGGKTEGEGKAEVKAEVKVEAKAQAEERPRLKAKLKAKAEGDGEHEANAEGTVEAKTDGDGEGEAKTEGRGEAKAARENDGEAKAQGKGKRESKVEGKGEAKAEGEGDAEAMAAREGEGEAKVEGMAEAKAEGEGAGEAETEGNIEAEAKGEGEREAKVEGEGMAKAEGEGEAEVEMEDTEVEPLSEGEGEGNEEEDGQEETQFTSTDIQVAGMLLGGVAFVIMLFMLVNYTDDDIRRYAWTLITSVTSIFVAVMMFSSVNEWILLFCETNEWGSPENITPTLCMVQYTHLFTWVCILQLTVAIASGSILEGPTHNLDVEEWTIADALRSDYGSKVDIKLVRNAMYTKSVVELRGMEIPVQKCKSNLDVRRRRMKCWGMLFAHMTGFAAINAGSTMQHLVPFRERPLLALLPILFNQAFINILFAIFKQMRDYLNRAAIKAGRAGRRAAMFSEEVMDSENDISCLAGSYMLVTTIRFALAPHELPNLVAEIKGNTPWHSVYLLYALGLAMSVIAVVTTVVKSFIIVGEEAAEGILARILEILAGMQSMAFGWACLFASRTVFAKTPALDAHNVGMNTISGRILLALCLSILSTVAIFGLDIVGDFFKSRFPGKNLGPDIIDKIVGAFSILVGFSWEHAFDGGVEAVASTTRDPHITDSVLAALVFIVIVPAWRRHILYQSMVLHCSSRIIASGSR